MLPFASRPPPLSRRAGGRKRREATKAWPNSWTQHGHASQLDAGRAVVYSQCGAYVLCECQILLTAGCVQHACMGDGYRYACYAAAATDMRCTLQEPATCHAVFCAADPSCNSRKFWLPLYNWESLAPTQRLPGHPTPNSENFQNRNKVYHLKSVCPKFLGV